MTPIPAVGRAIAALRGGRPVTIAGTAESGILAVETASAAMLELIDPGKSAELLLSGARAAALHIANRLHAAHRTAPVRIARSPWLDVASARALADPAADVDRAPLGPLDPLPPGNSEAARAAMLLARLAGLLPALWLVEPQQGVARVAAEDLLHARASVTLVARARLPIDGLPPSQMVSFRADDDGADHVALIVGAPGGRPPLTRMHSECLTGDVFRSLKCDCGPQLREALRLIGEAGGGVLLYLRQEGRGIGLPNKLRAYQLQDRGLDTVEANERLGFADDERDFAIGAAMLRALGIGAVRLLTNNPAKVSGLEAEGIAVVERVAHHMPANPHNADYLGVKRSRSGHLA